MRPLRRERVARPLPGLPPLRPRRYRASATQARRTLPPRMLRLASPDSPEREALEASLGPRSFKAFFRMAWRHIDSAKLVWNWHIDVLCEEMEAVARRQTRELVIAIPPRMGKSQILSVAFVAWVWTWFPAAKFITASYEMTLATRDAVKTRSLVESAWYQRRWGPGSKHLPPGHPGVALSKVQNNKTLYETTAGGARLCATPGTQVTGHGADFILGDDLNHVRKAEQEADRTKALNWWFETIPTRLNQLDHGVKIVIQQRVHAQDVAGECIKRGYRTCVLPMEFEPDHPQRHPKDPRTEPGELLNPGRVSPTGLAALKMALGPYASAGQLQQRPSPRSGGLFKREWFPVVEEVPAEARLNTVRRWDLAATIPKPGTDPDYTASVKMGRDAMGRVYILHAMWLRDTPGNVDLAIKTMASQDGGQNRTILPLDPGAAGIGRMEAQARFLAPLATEFARETGSKEERARGLASMAQAGNVFMLRGPWNDRLLDELTTFPSAPHDDLVDAASGAFIALYGEGFGIFDHYRAELEKLGMEVPESSFLIQKVNLG